MTSSSAEPLSPAEFSRGLTLRAVVCGAIMLAAVLVGIVFADPGAAPGSVPGWFGAPAFLGLTRGILLLGAAVIVDVVVVTLWLMTGNKRVAAWRERNAEQ